jgi:hypothetical protein
MAETIQSRHTLQTINTPTWIMVFKLSRRLVSRYDYNQKPSGLASTSLRTVNDSNAERHRLSMVLFSSLVTRSCAKEMGMLLSCAHK